MRRFLWSLLALLLLTAQASAAGRILDGEVSGEHELTLSLGLALPEDWQWQGNVTAVERENPDIPLTVESARLEHEGRVLVLTLAEPLSAQSAYDLTFRASAQDPVEKFTVSKGFLALLFSIVIGAALIQNFVFSRYLGLCIFFGASGRKETAVGMGFSFLLVMTLSAVFVWAIYNFVLKPLHLQFLQVLTFVGIIAIFVQFLDTVLRKVNPFLFKKLGVYLVLITTNCIILAVPLILVNNAYDLWESLALAVGSGLGFALALFLMACVRERLELADIPEVFRGLPIAFVVAGLFALAFLGFSGMSF